MSRNRKLPLIAQDKEDVNKMGSFGQGPLSPSVDIDFTDVIKSPRPSFTVKNKLVGKCQFW